MPRFFGNSSRWDNPQPRETGVVANSAVSGWPLINIVAVGNSNGQAMVFPDNAIKIKANPIIVPNDFTIQQLRAVIGIMGLYRAIFFIVVVF